MKDEFDKEGHALNEDANYQEQAPTKSDQELLGVKLSNTEKSGVQIKAQTEGNAFGENNAIAAENNNKENHIGRDSSLDSSNDKVIMKEGGNTLAQERNAEKTQPTTSQNENKVKSKPSKNPKKLRRMFPHSEIQMPSTKTVSTKEEKMNCEIILYVHPLLCVFLNFLLATLVEHEQKLNKLFKKTHSEFAMTYFEIYDVYVVPFTVMHFINAESVESLVSILQDEMLRRIYLAKEWFRLATLHQLHSLANVPTRSPIRLAREGFYCDHDHTIRCYDCSCIIDIDDPESDVHRPNCRAHINTSETIRDDNGVHAPGHILPNGNTGTHHNERMTDEEHTCSSFTNASYGQESLQGSVQQQQQIRERGVTFDESHSANHITYSRTRQATSIPNGHTEICRNQTNMTTTSENTHTVEASQPTVNNQELPFHDLSLNRKYPSNSVERCSNSGRNTVRDLENNTETKAVTTESSTNDDLVMEDQNGKQNSHNTTQVFSRGLLPNDQSSDPDLNLDVHDRHTKTNESRIAVSQSLNIRIRDGDPSQNPVPNTERAAADSNVSPTSNPNFESTIESNREVNMPNTENRQPKYPWPASFEERLETFADTPAFGATRSRQFAQAGQFYTGDRDITCCYKCGECLYYWRTGDDPFVEHARYYPDCPLSQQLNMDEGRPPGTLNEVPGTNDLCEESIIEENESLRRTLRCCVCRSRPVEVVCLRCGLLVMCRRCRVTTPTCPEC